MGGRLCEIVCGSGLHDGQNWTDVYKTDDGKGGVSEIQFAPVEAGTGG